MGKLFVVPLPIGNIKDITLRALDVLKSVDIIACEDSRNTLKLLNLLEIKPRRLIPYHDFNERNSAPGIIALINEGKTIALVSDAGMPTVNDPGFVLIRSAIQAQVELEVLPGPSALINTFVLANFGPTFTFLGFLKPKTIQRQNELKKLLPGQYIAFVSVHKLIKTLEDIALILGEQTQVFLGRELTKKFESHYRGTVKSVLEIVKIDQKGEFTIAFLKAI